MLLSPCRCCSPPENKSALSHTRTRVERHCGGGFFSKSNTHSKEEEEFEEKVSVLKRGKFHLSECEFRVSFLKVFLFFFWKQKKEEKRRKENTKKERRRIFV